MWCRPSLPLELAALRPHRRRSPRCHPCLCFCRAQPWGAGAGAAAGWWQRSHWRVEWASTSWLRVRAHACELSHPEPLLMSSAALLQTPPVITAACACDESRSSTCTLAHSHTRTMPPPQAQDESRSAANKPVNEPSYVLLPGATRMPLIGLGTYKIESPESVLKALEGVSFVLLPCCCFSCCPLQCRPGETIERHRTAA
jgi:hypothetical protein